MGFIRILKNEQRRHENQVRDMLNGVPPPRRRKKWRDMEERTVRLRNEYNLGARTLDEFWRTINHTIVEFGR